MVNCGAAPAHLYLQVARLNAHEFMGLGSFIPRGPQPHILSGRRYAETAESHFAPVVSLVPVLPPVRGIIDGN
jgi:hypothetical protein